MISTKDTETAFAGLSVVLRSIEASSQPTPLTSWLPEIQTVPIWIPLRKVDGITKVMPVLPEPCLYPTLMQSICQQIGQNSLVEWQQKPYKLTGVEVDSHSLHIIQVSISAAKPLPPTLGRAIHALCFHWFASADATLAENLHQQENLPHDFRNAVRFSQKYAVADCLVEERITRTPAVGNECRFGARDHLDRNTLSVR